ncbi:tetratricopeptide repeat protein [Winogradskyella thalassocola]|uniref:Tetratricopeptide repeat-containing protein n=1 Tax=Winogradskyella thalassocola TaxID=262004 RepID=A0A1G8HXG6_9FLAO|nr:tetratricopeptide repeat protein [Winogradskyella thalassocola]SDI11405.1 Tetratricopeptide repeat-containing protein [Winogradskyella thalassocola]
MYRFFWILLLTSMCFSQTSKEKAEAFIANKAYKKAQSEMLLFLKTNSGDNDAIELLGDAYGYQKKWDDAIEQYKTLTQRQPNNANYHYKFGGALGMKALSISKLKALGIIGDVKEAFLKAAELDPNHIETRWALVELYVSLPGIVGGSFSKALRYAEQLEQLSKVDGYLAKGYVYEYDDEPELAEKYYRLAIKIGGSVTCYEKLTNFYEGQKQPEKAIGNLEEAKDKHQRNAMHYQIGKVCADYNIQLDKGEDMLKVYLANHSAQDGVPKEWAYYRLAQIYKHKNNKVEALIWINKAISGLPDIDVFIEEKALINSL